MHKRIQLYCQTDFELRDHEHFVVRGIEADSEGTTDGIHGSTILSEFLYLPNSIPIDYMHLLCLGLFKNILKNFFCSSNHKELFYIGIYIYLLNRIFQLYKKNYVHEYIINSIRIF